MRNLTLAVEDEVLIEARKLAVEDGTTVNRLVRDYLRGYVRSLELRQSAAIRLKRRMAERPLAVGTRSWTRDELHER